MSDGMRIVGGMLAIGALWYVGLRAMVWWWLWVDRRFSRPRGRRG